MSSNSNNNSSSTKARIPFHCIYNPPKHIEANGPAQLKKKTKTEVLMKITYQATPVEVNEAFDTSGNTQYGKIVDPSEEVDLSALVQQQIAAVAAATNGWNETKHELKELRNEVSEIAKDNKILKIENKQLSKQVVMLQSEVTELQRENRILFQMTFSQAQIGIGNILNHLLECDGLIHIASTGWPMLFNAQSTVGEVLVSNIVGEVLNFFIQERPIWKQAFGGAEALLAAYRQLVHISRNGEAHIVPTHEIAEVSIANFVEQWKLLGHNALSYAKCVVNLYRVIEFQ
jgi:regulator of replication initiation timing